MVKEVKTVHKVHKVKKSIKSFGPSQCVLWRIVVDQFKNKIPCKLYDTIMFNQ